MASVYYLDRTRTDGLRLYTECHTSPPTELPVATFEAYYRHVADVDWSDLDRILTGFSTTGAETAPAFRDSDLRAIGVGDVVTRRDEHFLCTPGDWQAVRITE